MRTLWSLLLALSCLACGRTAAPTLPAPPDEAAVAAALEELYTDDYTVTDAAGQTRTEADELAYVRSSPSARLLAGSYRLIKVRVFGDIAVATGQATLRGESEDGPFEHTYYSFNVFRREHGRWRYAAAFTP